MTNTDIITTAAAPAARTVAPGGTELLASDAERERIADRLRAAAAEGRLTLDEADERQAVVYAARTRAELPPLVSDLPGSRPRAGRPPRPPMTDRARRRYHVHAAIVAVLIVSMVVGAVVSALPFPPLGVLFLLALSLFVHSRRAERVSHPDDGLPAELR